MFGFLSYSQALPEASEPEHDSLRNSFQKDDWDQEQIGLKVAVKRPQPQGSILFPTAIKYIQAWSQSQWCSDEKGKWLQ